MLWVFLIERYFEMKFLKELLIIIKYYFILIIIKVKILIKLFSVLVLWVVWLGERKVY